MAKDKLTDYSATASSNTDVGGVDIGESTMVVSDINNALREIMSHLADFSAGTTGVDVLNLQDDDASASVKLQAPATVSSSVTYTLPDTDGSNGQSLTTDGSGTLSFATVGTNASDLSSGTVPSARLSLTDADMPSGVILQGEHAEMSSAPAEITNSTWADLNISDSITPRSTSSKILVMVNANVWHKGNQDSFGFRLLRGSTVIRTHSSVTYHDERQASVNASSKNGQTWVVHYIDSPSSTSEQTYKVQAHLASGSSASLELKDGDIVLLEIQG